LSHAGGTEVPGTVVSPLTDPRRVCDHSMVVRVEDRHVPPATGHVAIAPV